MALGAGTRLGAYEITGALGAGGMGEVYRATDSELKRDVAIKVLPESLADDAERLARFRREAELLAALSHPNIAHVYGLEHSDGSTALVMELIDGPTLAERIAEGPIPIDEALEIASQIADALEAAHGQGIVHRDLKPANIKLRPDGLVKVLDFGIAKALDERAGTSGPRAPSLTRTSMTRAGIVLGTAAYMSPEQARGKPVDQRADIWGFGCILYEMLTGQPAFAGEDDTSTLAKVLERETDMSGLSRAITAPVRQALELCLRKNPAERVADIRDVRLALRGGFQPAVAERPRWRLAASVVLAAGLAAVAGWILKPGAPPSSGLAHQVIRAHLDVADGQHLSGGFPWEGQPFGLQRPSRPSMAFSPDGRYLVYAASDGKQTHLYRHVLSQDRVNALAGTEGAVQPFFSPDGSSVGFFVGNELKRLDIETGAVRTVAIQDPKLIGGTEVIGSRTTSTGDWTTGSWTRQDTILFSSRDGIYEVPASGGTPVRLTTVMTDIGERLQIFPQMLPWRQGLLYTSVTASNVPSEWNVVLQPLDGGDRRVLVKGATDARYLPTGHIVFARAGSLLAMPFDLNTLKPTGTQAVVIDDVMYAQNGGGGLLNTGTAQVAISAAGSLAYVPGGIYPTVDGKLGWVDQSGESQAIPLPAASYLYPRLSPDGGRLVYAAGDINNMRLWVDDLKLGVPNSVTTSGSYGPVWSPDGTRLALTRGLSAGEIYTVQADGSSQPKPIGPDVKGQPASWSRDDVLAFVHIPTPDAPSGIWTIRLDGNSKPEPFVETAAEYPSFSPDGKWIAYVSRETGTREVYVRPFPQREPRQRISTAGGIAPVWSRDGSKLYFRTFDAASPGTTVMMEVDVTTEPKFTHTRPRELFRGKFGGSVSIRSYDISPDGKRFVMLLPPEQKAQPVTRINIVLNWFDELKRLVPTK